MVTNEMRPIHPGEQLRDELEEIELSARGLAEALGVPANRITEILNEKRGVSADTPLKPKTRNNAATEINNSPRFIKTSF